MGPEGVVESRCGGGVRGSLLMCMPLSELTVIGDTWPPTMPWGTGLQHMYMAKSTCVYVNTFSHTRVYECPQVHRHPYLTFTQTDLLGFQ